MFNQIKKVLNHFPKIKKTIKDIISLLYITMSNERKKSYGNIIKISPDDGYEYFFGYYDKSPWDFTGRYILCLKAKCTYKSAAPAEEAKIVMFDTYNHTTIELGTTHTWNTQQGCMLQWLGPDYHTKIIYNDFINSQYCSVIMDINTREKNILNMPVYSVSNSGKFALSLDFARLHRLRPGYGYSNLKDKTEGELLPDKACIWKINLEDGNIDEILRYVDFYNLDTREDMKNAEHKVNHIMINPKGDRFMVLHRWFKNEKKYTRLVTCNIDGSDMYNLSDDNFVSHCCWKNDKEILAYERKNNTDGFYLMKDQTQKYKHMWDFIIEDGHPTYSPDKKNIVADTYPDKRRMSQIYLLNEENQYEKKVIAKVYSPFKFYDEFRCDLHPRWSREGNKICFDGVFEGKRALYYVNVKAKE